MNALCARIAARKTVQLSLAATLFVLAQLSEALANPSGPTSPTPPVSVPAGPGTAGTTETFDTSKGYLHEASGVGFIYPDGWDRSDVTTMGRVTALDMKAQGGSLHVSLYWTALTSCTKPVDFDRLEVLNLRQLYGNSVGDPEPMLIAGQQGYRISIARGPLGDTPGSGLVGVVYVFAVHCDGQAWKIKLRATVHGEQNLQAIGALLNNYSVH